MSVNSRRTASSLATAALLCLTALSSPSLAGEHGGGGGDSMSGGAAQMSGHTSMGAGPDHSSGAAADHAPTGTPAQNAAKTAAVPAASGEKITIQQLIQADRAVHMRNMN
jgi:hypothetical protein